MLRFWTILFFLATTFLFGATLYTTSSKIGSSFPGYLTFKNGVVGAFYSPDWSGAKEGLVYHQIAPAQKERNEVFSSRDFTLVVLLPALSGILFFLIGAALSFYLPVSANRLPFLFFHFLAGNYLILSPEFHLTYHFSYLHLIFFALLPASMLGFAFSFPERMRNGKRISPVYWIPYVISGLLLIPYLFLFERNPSLWIRVEYLVVFYVIAAYLLWIARLVANLKKPQLEFNRIIARYLLIGQIVAFLIPLLASVAIFAGGIPFPLNLATPFTLLFPAALFVGTVLARLKSSQMQLILSEKKAALGNLLAGLAHEINNPMTFVYSNIEPLRETMGELRGQSLATHGKTAALFGEADEIINNMEEGATRAKAIIDNFRFFSYRDGGKREETDLQSLLEQSLILLTPKWKNRIEIKRSFGEIPMVPCNRGEMGQVFVNILSNACDAIDGHGTIEMTTSSDAGHVRISVKDNGRGMGKNELIKIFDPFYTTKVQGEGCGLGLAIALEIVKKHKGKIDVISELGKGSEFVIRIPR